MFELIERFRQQSTFRDHKYRIVFDNMYWKEARQNPHYRHISSMNQGWIYIYIMHYTLDYDSASTTKANIDKWRVSLRVIYQDHERAASVGRRSSTNNVCNNVASRFFNFTFTGIPLANPPFFPLFPPFSSFPHAALPPRIDFRFQFNGVVVSEPRSSNTNFALSACARRRWLPSCQTPFAPSSKSPEERRLSERDHGMEKFKVQVVPGPPDFWESGYYCSMCSSF